VFRDFGWPEALIILAVVLIIFGAGKLPQIGGAVGKSIRDFRKAKDSLDEEEGEEGKPKSKKTTRKLTAPKTGTKQS
jgi:sec-independent protein translocase protein TatA